MASHVTVFEQASYPIRVFCVNLINLGGLNWTKAFVDSRLTGAFTSGTPALCALRSVNQSAVGLKLNSEKQMAKS
jgi:hypothetical protein